jgi:uncharacterized alkaline shock family protein YloU
MSFVRATTYILGASFSAALGVLAVLAAARTLGDIAWRWLIEHPPGVPLLAFVGGSLLLITGHFIRLVVEERSGAVDLLRDGTWGQIALSPVALRQFIGDLLRREIGLERFRVRLRRGDQGVVIEIITALPATMAVSEIGEHMQRLVAERVTQQVGVDVERVTITVRSMRASGSALQEHDRVDA